MKLKKPNCLYFSKQKLSNYCAHSIDYIITLCIYRYAVEKMLHYTLNRIFFTVSDISYFEMQDVQLKLQLAHAQYQ